MTSLPEEPVILKQWEKPSLMVLPVSETQHGSGSSFDGSACSS